jgi:hypothetical protein
MQVKPAFAYKKYGAIGPVVTVVSNRPAHAGVNLGKIVIERKVIITEAVFPRIFPGRQLNMCLHKLPVHHVIHPQVTSLATEYFFKNSAVYIGSGYEGCVAITNKFHEGPCVVPGCVKFIADININGRRINIGIRIKTGKSFIVDVDEFIIINFLQQMIGSISTKGPGILILVTFLQVRQPGFLPARGDREADKTGKKKVFQEWEQIEIIFY